MSEVSESMKWRQILLLLYLAIVVPPLTVGAEDDGSGTVHLDEIVVSATRTPVSLDDISAMSSVVTERQIRASTAADLGHLLSAADILTVSDYGPGGIITASIRGSSSEQVLVLVDGERINDPRSGGADLDNVPMACAKRIEVIRGGQSAVYGADAVGGVINVITRQPSGTGAAVWSTLGAYDFTSWGVEASKQIGAASCLISLSRTDGEANFPFRDKYGRELIRENAEFMKRSALGKLRWDISSSATISLSGDHYYSDKGDPGPMGMYSPDASKRDRSNGLRVNLEQKLSKNTLCKLSIHGRSSVLRYVNPQQPYPVDDTHRTDTRSAELQAHFLRGTATPLICGVSFRDDSVDSTALGEHERRTYSGYIQQELNRDLSDGVLHLSRIAIFPAVRWDHYSDFKAGISPKLGFLASFGRRRIVDVRANVGGSYRAPAMNDLYWSPDAFAVGNPDLRPERAVNAVVGLYLRLSSVFPQLSLVRCGVSYFWNAFKDRIQWSPGAGGKWSPQNLSEAHSEGLEAEVRARASLRHVPGLVDLRAGYTFLKAEDMLGRQLVYRPKHSLGYTIHVGSERLWGQMQGIYRSRRYYTVQNTRWLEPFMRHDLQLGMERRLWRSASASLTFEVRNIFDTRYQLIADYPLPGREWSVKTSVRIGGE